MGTRAIDIERGIEMGDKYREQKGSGINYTLPRSGEAINPKIGLLTMID